MRNVIVYVGIAAACLALAVIHGPAASDLFNAYFYAYFSKSSHVAYGVGAAATVSALIGLEVA